MRRRSLKVVSVLLVVAVAALGTGTLASPRTAAQAAPTVTQITPTYSPAAGGAAVTITGTNFSTAAGGTQFTDEGENPLFTNVTCSSTTQCTATSLPMQVEQQSAFVGEVYAIVGGGQSGSGLQFVWYGQPGITRLTPASAKAGTVVTLHGGVFPSSGVYGGPVSIMFGDRPATGVACPNIDECYGQAPGGSGTVQVTITTPGGTSNSLPFTYAAPGLGSPEPPSHPSFPGIPSLPEFPAFPDLPPIPGFPGFPAPPGGAAPLTVTAITPNYGPAAGGTRVTLTGAGFSTASGATQFAAAQFQFTDVVCASTTRCTAVTPSVAVASGSAVIGDSISVTVNGQTSQNQNLFFVWYGTPQLSSVQPSSGAAAGGTTVTLTGGVFPSNGGLPGPVSVRFGATPATNVSCNDDGGSCTAVSPPGSGTVQVTITTPGGTSSGQPFTYAAAAPGAGTCLSLPIRQSVSAGESWQILAHTLCSPATRACVTTNDSPAELVVRWQPQGSIVGVFQVGVPVPVPPAPRTFCEDLRVGGFYLEFRSNGGTWKVEITALRW